MKEEECKRVEGKKEGNRKRYINVRERKKEGREKERRGGE